jgi:replication factor A2
MFGSSQGFGYDAVAAPTQEAPKRAKQEEKQTCIPVTVRILQDAVARHADSQEILIHGTEASIVHIVGVVEALVEQTAMTEFQINDGSGRMKVRHYASSGSASSGLVVGRYVSVVGNVRTSPAAHVSAMSMQAVMGGDEVSYHMIEVAHAALKLRNPTTVASVGASVAASDPITPGKQMGLGLSNTTMSPAKVEEPPRVMAAPMDMQMSTPPKGDLRTSVLDVLRQVQESAGEEGFGLANIAARLQVSSDKVKDVLSKLVDEGDVFTTIDDDHFAVI